MLNLELTVLHDFEDYAKGDFIVDEGEIKRILGSEHALRVVKVPAGTHGTEESAPKPAPAALAAPAVKSNAPAPVAPPTPPATAEVVLNDGTSAKT